MKYKFETVIAVAVVAAVFLGIQNVEATGGAGIIAEKVLSQLQDALTYLNEGDSQAAAQEIQNAINELKDTYEADKEE